MTSLAPLWRVCEDFFREGSDATKAVNVNSAKVQINLSQGDTVEQVSPLKRWPPDDIFVRGPQYGKKVRRMMIRTTGNVEAWVTVDEITDTLPKLTCFEQVPDSQKQAAAQKHIALQREKIEKANATIRTLEAGDSTDDASSSSSDSSNSAVREGSRWRVRDYVFSKNNSNFRLNFDTL